MSVYEINQRNQQIQNLEAEVREKIQENSKLIRENAWLHHDLDAANSKLGELMILAHNLLNSLYHGRTADNSYAARVALRNALENLRVQNLSAKDAEEQREAEPMQLSVAIAECAEWYNAMKGIYRSLGREMSGMKVPRELAGEVMQAIRALKRERDEQTEEQRDAIAEALPGAAEARKEAGYEDEVLANERPNQQKLTRADVVAMIESERAMLVGACKLAGLDLLAHTIEREFFVQGPSKKER